MTDKTPTTALVQVNGLKVADHTTHEEAIRDAQSRWVAFRSERKLAETVDAFAVLPSGHWHLLFMNGRTCR